MPNLPIKKSKPLKLLSEEEVKKMFGTDDFRKVKKSQIVQVISSLSQMDPEVAVKVIEQVPDVSRAALGMAKEMKESLVASLDANNKSSEQALAQIDAIIHILTGELEDETLTPEERVAVIKGLVELGNRPVEIHKANQQFIMKGLTMVASVVGASLVGIVAVLGANGKIELPELPQQK